MSQNKLAKKAGVKPASISKIEDGLVGSSREMVLKIADALEVNRIDAILAWLADPGQKGGSVDLPVPTSVEAQELLKRFEKLPDPVKPGVVAAVQGLYEAVSAQSSASSEGRDLPHDINAIVDGEGGVPSRSVGPIVADGLTDAVAAHAKGVTQP
jgi:DNA-binding XRE family transcriptional regulator